jgi:hypothetical protein
MKKHLLSVFSNQHGSVINVALLILILIFLIGIGLSKMSTTDIKIANNIKQDMTTFYETDAGLEATGDMIEQNLACSKGFFDTPNGTDGLPGGEEIIGGTFYVKDLKFAYNTRDTAFIPAIDSSDADFYYPKDYGDPTDPHTNVKIGGATRFSRGSAIQMAAGYEGLGKGSAGGGASVIYDVYVQRFGRNNTSSTHFMQWVHILGSSGACNYSD